MSQSLPAPTNWLTKLIDLVLDALIMGFGEDAIYTLVIAQVPWLATPVLNIIVKRIIHYLCQRFDNRMKIGIGNIAIRFQGDLRRNEHDAAIGEMQKTVSDPNASAEAKRKAIQDAKNKIDRLVERDRPRP